jgi:hypothetical protein
MRSGSIIIMLVFFSVTASAQPAMTSAYCLSGAAGFFRGEDQGFAEMKKCQRGDTIVIPSGSASVVARVCDFGKAIVSSGSNVVCVLQGERGRR